MKKEILCLDCGCYFFLASGARKAYKAKGLNIPTHCPACRSIRWKEERTQIRRAKKFERNYYNEKH